MISSTHTILQQYASESSTEAVPAAAAAAARAATQERLKEGLLRKSQLQAQLLSDKVVQLTAEAEAAKERTVKMARLAEAMRGTQAGACVRACLAFFFLRWLEDSSVSCARSLQQE
jgi:hypothetical protein